jgi:phosphoribosylaminoimidazolecarboxamide formyltransferase / IMP cyclohydrolase
MAAAIPRALLSVSDKTELLTMARGLHALGFELISTGGTAKTLRESGLAVRDVADVTGFPEIMDGRVKTLHPRIHGGLLGRVSQDDAVMRAHDIAPIDVLVVNLYPFAATIAKPDCSIDEAIENIDIGGPAMLRAAAKNHERVLVLTDPKDYARALAALQTQGNTLALRRELAAKTYAHTARYDGMVAEYLGLCSEASDQSAPAAAAKAAGVSFPPSLHCSLSRAEVLRYGENPHQSAALYLEHELPQAVVANARFLQGKTLSFNNLADADAALECVKLFDEPACVIVKHANPCGVACASDLLQAYERAFETDPVSAFGGIIAFNRALDSETAKRLIAQQFVEVIIAPDFSEGALAAIASKPNVRVLATGSFSKQMAPWRDYKRIQGALLVQSGDRDTLSAADCKVVSERQPTASEFSDLLFAWKVAMQVKSNAIVYALAQRTIGIGAGQMSRVISAKIAAMKAQEANLKVEGSVLASDAFFPFRDGIDAAASVGIRAIIQPGGSMRDKEVIEAANQHRMAMLFTSIRHFKH